MKKWTLTTLALLLILWIGTAFISVDETEFAVVTRFGKVVKSISEPGLAVKAPWPVDRVTRIDRRRRAFLGEPDECITKDRHNVRISSYIIWEVTDPVRFLSSIRTIRTAEERLRSHLSGTIGGLMSMIDLNDLVNTDPASHDVEALTDKLNRTIRGETEEDYGVRIVDVRLRRINFPDQNREVIFQRMRAAREKLINEYRSEGDRIAAKIKSEAERDAAIRRAEGKRVAEVIRGEGEAEAARIYNLAFAGNAEFYEFVQHLDTLKKIFKEGDTIVVPLDWDLTKVLYGEGAGSK